MGFCGVVAVSMSTRPLPDLNVCHAHRFVLWALPRTAARYVWSALSQYGSMAGLTHAVGVPHGCEDYDIICTVRNPYTRLLSGWKWMNQIHGGAHHPGDFPRFVRETAPGYVRPITEILGTKVGKITHLLHVENLHADLRALPCIPESATLPPNVFQSEYDRPWQEYYTTDALKRTRIIYEADFREFEYTTHL